MSKLKKVMVAIVVLLMTIQFIHPAKNISTQVSANKIETPPDVEQILKTSCNDCHSNNTVYPWYNNVQPVAWWLAHHVNEGKKELNFDEFAAYKPHKQYHKMEELDEMINEDEMPLPSYTFIHRNAKLSVEQKQILARWSWNIRSQLELIYPIDSLTRPKQKN